MTGASPDRWIWTRKRVPELPDGIPRHSILAELARDVRSGIVQEQPGRYRSG